MMKSKIICVLVWGLLAMGCDSDDELSTEGSFFESRAGTVWDAPVEEQPDALHLRVGMNENTPFESFVNRGGTFGECYNYFPYGVQEGGFVYDSFEVEDVSSDVIRIILTASLEGQIITERHTYFVDGNTLVDDFVRFSNEQLIGSGSQYFFASTIDVDQLELCTD